VHQNGQGSGDASAADEPGAARRCEQVVTIQKKFVLALIAYAVLGILAWTTLSDEPIQILNANIRLRTGTLLILGLFAFRSALFFWRTRIEIEEEQEQAKSTD
jgi:hypothetical protein